MVLLSTADKEDKEPGPDAGDGVTNSGGAGGGGSSGTNPQNFGAAGGSGIVIIRYKFQ